MRILIGRRTFKIRWWKSPFGRLWGFILFFPLIVFARTDPYKYTNIGNIALTVTNFGILGNGFRVYDPQTHEPLPSCEYPLGSRTEHLYRAGLWVGAKLGDSRFVSTGVIDALNVTPGSSQGFEFLPTPYEQDSVIEKSTLITSPYYDLSAISEQDFYATYYDTFSIVPDHHPLGLQVNQVSLAWSYSYIDDAVIIDYTIKNIGRYDLDSVYLGIYAELVTGNRDFWGEDFGRTPFFQHKRLFYLDSLRMAYERNDGYDYLAQGMVGIKILGLMDDSDRINLDSMVVSFNWWHWDYSVQVPDSQRYVLMSNGERDPDVDDEYVATNGYVDPAFLISVGPIERLRRGDSLRFVIAVVGGMNEVELQQNANWAQRAFEANYILPAPPPSPRLVAIPGDRKVTLYFDNSPEFARDPTPPHLRDFEGYRIYRGTSELLADSSWILLRQYDKTPDDTIRDVDHSIGFNTGLPEIETQGPYAGWYKYVDYGVKNGFTYYYAVTSYDVGNPDIGLPSLESSLRQNMVRVVPGTPPASDKKVYVYPNPYRKSSVWDSPGPFGRVIRFNNLPEKCTIYIFNLAGDLVKTIHHDDPIYGEESWNLITDKDQEVATGLYYFVVKDEKTGKVQRGKFLIIK